MKTHLRISHLSFNLCLWSEGCNRVDDYDVDCAGTDEVVSDFESLLPVVRLRDEQSVEVYAEILCVTAIKGVLRIDDCCDSALFLSLGNRMDCEGCLTAGLRSVDFDDPSARVSSDSQCMVKRDGTARNH